MTGIPSGHPCVFNANIHLFSASPQNTQQDPQIIYQTGKGKSHDLVSYHMLIFKGHRRHTEDKWQQAREGLLAGFYL